MQYELFYLVGQRQEANLDAIKKGVEEILALENATLIDPEQMEKRKLAYEIKHQNKGVYITRRFELPEIDFWADEANGEKEFGIEAITKKLNLNNDVLRFLIVKTDDLPDLGAKDRRKEKELANGTGRAPQRPQRTDSRDNRNSRPMQRPTRPAAPRPAAAAPAKKVEAPVAKEQSKNIDKQLDELLNI